MAEQIAWMAFEVLKPSSGGSCLFPVREHFPVVPNSICRYFPYGNVPRGAVTPENSRARSGVSLRAQVLGWLPV